MIGPTYRTTPIPLLRPRYGGANIYLCLCLSLSRTFILWLLAAVRLYMAAAHNRAARRERGAALYLFSPVQSSPVQPGQLQVPVYHPLCWT